MKVWFIRSNGDTGHNNPDFARYVEGEPPTYPETIFDHREICLSQGFARIGWPATGDVSQPGWEQKGAREYTDDEFKDGHRSYLKRFSGIETGDLLVMPSGGRKYDVHLGCVVLRDRNTRKITTLKRGLPAYYYHFDISKGDWFENAHRVDVAWYRGADGLPTTYSFPALGGCWLRAFAAVRKSREAIVAVAARLSVAEDV